MSYNKTTPISEEQARLRKHLKKYMTENHMNNAELGRRADLSGTTIGNFLKGQDAIGKTFGKLTVATDFYGQNKKPQIKQTNMTQALKADTIEKKKKKEESNQISLDQIAAEEPTEYITVEEKEALKEAFEKYRIGTNNSFVGISKEAGYNTNVTVLGDLMCRSDAKIKRDDYNRYAKVVGLEVTEATTPVVEPVETVKIPVVEEIKPVEPAPAHRGKYKLVSDEDKAAFVKKLKKFMEETTLTRTEILKRAGLKGSNFFVLLRDDRFDYPLSSMVMDSMMTVINGGTVEKPEPKVEKEAVPALNISNPHDLLESFKALKRAAVGNVEQAEADVKKLDAEIAKLKEELAGLEEERKAKEAILMGIYQMQEELQKMDI